MAFFEPHDAVGAVVHPEPDSAASRRFLCDNRRRGSASFRGKTSTRACVRRMTDARDIGWRQRRLLDFDEIILGIAVELQHTADLDQGQSLCSHTLVRSEDCTNAEWKRPDSGMIWMENFPLWKSPRSIWKLVEVALMRLAIVGDFAPLRHWSSS